MNIQNQFFRFAAVGISGTTVQYIVLWLGVSAFSAPAALASAVGYVLGSLVNYFLNHLFTFQSEKSHREAAPKYFAVLGVDWCINTGLMVILVHHFGWNYWFAQLLTTSIVLFWNFLGSRWWAFKQVQV